MRKLLIIILIALLAGVAVVALIETDPGYVLIAYGNYTLESSLWVGLLVLAVFTGLVYLLVRSIRRLLSGQDSLLSWLGNRQARRAAKLTTQGLLSFIEGNWVKSRRQLLRGVKGNDTPLLNYLAAARASHRLDDTDKMREYLAAAKESESRAGVAVELTQAEIKLQAGEYDKALTSLDRAKENVGRHPYVLEVMYRAHLALGNWGDLAGMLGELKKHKVLSEQALRGLERTVYTHLLENSAAEPEGAAANVQAVWQRLPGGLKNDPGLLRTYIALLVATGATDQAEKAIVRALKKDWDEALVRQYGLLAGSNPGKQLAQAESWLAAHDGDAELLLCLGRLAARDSLWGKARDYFEASYRVAPGVEICAELGRLLHAMGEEKVAGAYFREGLLLRETGLPELPEPDRAVSRAHRLASQ